MKQVNLEEILISTILRKYNLNKLSFLNIEKLVQILKTNHQFTISANTLARIAGLRQDKRNTYTYNLDALSSILGFGTYQNFEKFMLQKSNFRITKSNENASDFLSTYTIEATQNNDIKFLRSLEKYIETKGIGIENYYSIGTAIMLGCRQNKFPQKIIDYSISSPILTQMFYETYVDMDYLNGYFGEAMITLSRLHSSNNSTFLFSNSIAYLCERSRNKVSNYKKRGKMLLDIDISFIELLVNDKYIYPVARWLRACIDFCLLNRSIQQAQELFEYSTTLIQDLSPDNSIITISEISEIDNRILPVEFLSKLKELFLLKSNDINYEYDCYLNAALNLSIKLGCRDIITYPQALKIFKSHAFRFVTRSNSILNKINILQH